MSDQLTPSLESPPDAEVRAGGRDFLYFGGTSYLGLHAHPETIEAAVDATRRFGLHTATSRSGFGTAEPLRSSESALAEFFGREAAFHCASGWAAPSILTAGLRQQFEVAFVDRDAHYAVHDAARQSARAVFTFAHREPEDLERQLARHANSRTRPIVMTDGVFALTGAIAPLQAYVDVLERGPTRGGILLVDDAHGVGVLGAHGRGSIEGLEVPSCVDVYQAGTLSKALGGHGGFVTGDRSFVEHARSAAHWFEGSTPPTHAAAAASACALRIAHREPERRERLRTRGDRLRRGLRALGVTVDERPTPIIALPPESPARGRQLETSLRERGLLVPYFATYSGATANGVLRIAVFATHTDAHIDTLVDALRELL